MRNNRFKNGEAPGSRAPFHRSGVRSGGAARGSGLGWAVLAILATATPLQAQGLGLGLSVSPSAPSANIGSSITYTVNVTNLIGLTIADLFVTNAFSTPVTVQDRKSTRLNSSH